MSDPQGAGSGPHDQQRPLSDEERAKLFHEQVKRLRIIDLVRATLADVVTLGYQKLGLTAETADLRDLGDVRVAIETVRRLVEVLESEGADDEARTYRATLASMQLQFAAAASGAAADVDDASVAPDAADPGAEAKRAATETSAVTETAASPKAGPAAAKKPAAKKPAAKKPAAAKKRAATKKPPAGAKDAAPKRPK